MVKIPNLIDRTWIMSVSNDGTLLLNCNRSLDKNFYVPNYAVRYHAHEVQDLATDEAVPYKLREQTLKYVGNRCGIFFNDNRDIYKVLNEWNYMNRRMDKTPVLIFERETLDSTKIDCIVTMSCADSMFVEKQLPQTGPLYRNKESLTNAFQVPAMPKPEKLQSLWDRWLDGRQVFGLSRKYFCEKLYGYPTKLSLLREKNLALSPGNDPDKREYLLLRLLTMETREIQKLTDMGFVWNRFIQAWAGETTQISLRDFDDFIRRDTLATPAIMGFVPEWSANIDIQDITVNHHKIVSKTSAKAFDNSELWDMISV